MAVVDKLRGLLETLFHLLRVFQFTVFGGDQPQHHLLFTGFDKTQRFKPAGPLIVILQEEGVDIHLTEQDLRHRLIATFGDPGGTEVAAANVQPNGQIVRLVGDRGIQHIGINTRQAIRILSALADLPALFV
ncbi:hypothetical protein D3C81_1108930 [compost metagenome]